MRTTARPKPLSPMAETAKLVMQSGVQLHEHLAVDELSYRLIAPTAHRANAPDVYFYSALDLAIKACASVLAHEDFIDTGDKYDPTRAIDRLLLEMSADEYGVWRRRLIEALVDVICAQQVPDPRYFAHRFHIRELVELASTQRDLETFYSCRSKNHGSTIDRVRAGLSELEDGLDLERACAWYLREPKPAAGLSERQIGRALAPFNTRLERALPHATHRERMIIGGSYAPGFGAASAAVHFTGMGARHPLSVSDVEQEAGLVVILALSLVYRVQEATGKIPAGPNTRLREFIDDSSYGEQLGEFHSSGRANVGDIVFAYGFSWLGQVIEVRTGLVGYESYHVRFICDPPLPETPDDWFIASLVHLVFPFSDYAAGTRKYVEEGRLTEQQYDKLMSTPEGDQHEALAESTRRLWKAAGDAPFRQMAALQRERREPKG